MVKNKIEVDKISIFALGVLALSLSFSSCKGNKQNDKDKIPEYAVEVLNATNVEMNSSYPVAIKGKQDIEIRPQVSGTITRLCVDEGAMVRKGQELFIIDDVQYREAVNVARAALNVARANVATARLTALNKKELAKNNIIGTYDFQMAENSLLSAKAALSEARAQLVSAEKNLSYTRVKSPSNGVVGTIPFRVGSLVGPSITTPLTTVSDISEMYAYFSMTEKQLLSLTSKGKSSREILKDIPPVQLKMIDGSIYNETGRVETMSGVIDQSTGSVTLRARFANKRQVLRSGETGSILIPSKLTNCIVVPQKATYEIQDRKFVYVVDARSVVKSVLVEVLALDDGMNYAVTSGLNKGDKIVVEGIASLKDGMQIKAIMSGQAAGRSAQQSDKEGSR